MASATAAPTYEVGTLYHVDPTHLLLERNIRLTTVDKDFVASVKDRGVVVPITAVLNDDGRLVVRLGHRRALAAVETARATVPVYVAGRDSLENADEIDRLIDQHDENTRRAPLTTAENVAFVEQLAAFGLSPAQIVKRKRMPRAEVDAALAVAQSNAASTAAAEVESLTLDQAAVLVEFEDDPQSVEVLAWTATEDPNRFLHEAQRMRDERIDKAAKAELVASLEKHGVKVVDGDTMRWQNELRFLKVSAGGAQLTKVNHAKCEGHVGWIEQRGWTKDNRPKYEIAYGCEDPSKHGHYSTVSSPRAPGAEKSDAEREKDKQARALVVSNNKAWKSATTVRREFLKTFALQKSAPTGAAAFIAWAISFHAGRLNDASGKALAAELLRVDEGKVHELAEKSTTDRALLIVLVQVIACLDEAAVDQMTWRRSGKRWDKELEWHAGYLTFLEDACGYPLSDVEKFAVSSKTA